MTRIFISHSSKDKELVQQLSADLKAIGYEVWLDEWEIRIGDCIVRAVGEGLVQAEFVIVVLSPNAVASGWVEREWAPSYLDEIETRRRILLPVLVQNCEIPVLLKTKRYADFRGRYADGFAELLVALGSPALPTDDGMPEPAPNRSTDAMKARLHVKPQSVIHEHANAIAQAAPFALLENSSTYDDAMATALKVVPRDWSTSKATTHRPREPRTTIEHPATVMSVCLSPNGRLLATGALDYLRWWDLTTAPPRLLSEQLYVEAGSLAFSPDSRMLVSGNSAGSLVIWDMATSHGLLPGTGSWANVVAFSPDGKFIATAGGSSALGLSAFGNHAELWQVENSDGTLSADKISYVQCASALAISWVLGGRMVLLATSEGLSLLPAPGPWRFQPFLGTEVSSVATTPRGRAVAFAIGEEIRVVDLPSGQHVADFSVPGGGEGTVLAMSPSGDLFASGHVDGVVWLWDLRSRTAVRRYECDGYTVLAVAFSSDGQTLATAAADRKVRLWATG